MTNAPIGFQSRSWQMPGRRWDTWHDNPRENLFSQTIGSDLKRRFVRGEAATLGTQGANVVLQPGSVMILPQLLIPDNLGLNWIVTRRWRSPGISAK
jgi:hypothetical protein